VKRNEIKIVSRTLTKTALDSSAEFNRSTISIFFLTKNKLKLLPMNFLCKLMFISILFIFEPFDIAQDKLFQEVVGSRLRSNFKQD